MNDLIDRYARGELKPEEARQLAQQSLDDHDLFEELTASALVRSAIESGSAILAVTREEPAPRVRYGLFGLAAAASIVIAASVSWRAPGPPRRPPLAGVPSIVISSTQPVLLVSDPFPSGSSIPLFRGNEPVARDPRQRGTSVSIEEGEAIFDVGAVDGVVNGATLEVFRGSQRAGSLTVTAVFRERTRGRIRSSTPVGNGATVRIADTDFFSALYDQVESASASGHISALQLAEELVQWASTAAVPEREKHRALLRLATLEYRAGRIERAEQHFQTAAENPDSAQPAEQAMVRNNLAVFRLLRGDSGGAKPLLSEALVLSPKPDSLRAKTLNNLGVLDEMSGNRQKAEAHYREALRQLDSVTEAAERDRLVIERNLTRLREIR